MDDGSERRRTIPISPSASSRDGSASSPSYLSKIERGEQPPPGEEMIRRIADEFDEDRDVLLAVAGKVSGDLVEIIRQRPALIAELLRSIRPASAKRISEIARQVRDGDW